jgi:hypothetical protein
MLRQAAGFHHGIAADLPPPYVLALNWFDYS